MDKIDKIIKEEINRLILFEAIDFTNLNNLASQLNDSLGNIRDFSANKSINANLRKFFYNFVVYCVQIVAAINRCAQANNLNEASLGGLSNYGINLPGVLGGNLWSDAKEGWHKGKYAFQDRGGFNGSYSNANGLNPNTVPSVKLQDLLQKIPEWESAYARAKVDYGLNGNPSYQAIINDFNKILVGSGSIIAWISAEYQNQLRNAQNP